MNDDPNETLRLAVLSWLKLEEHIASGRLAPTAPKTCPLVTSGVLCATGQRGPDLARSCQTTLARPGTTVLPVISTVQHVHDGGAGRQRQRRHGDVRDALREPLQSMRQCNTCSLQIGCPSFQPHAPCSYQIPVPDQEQGRTQWGPPALVRDPDPAHPAGPFRGGSEWRAPTRCSASRWTACSRWWSAGGRSRTTGTA